jgi:hypothetical protein
VTLPSTAEQTADRSAPVTYRSVVVLAALVLLPGLAYVSAILLPYYASDLDTLSLTDLAAGLRPPTDLGSDGAGWLSLLGVLAIFLTPLGALLALGGSALQLLAAFPRSPRRVSPGVATGLGVVALGCVVTLTFLLSPLGAALTSWHVD